MIRAAPRGGAASPPYGTATTPFRSQHRPPPPAATARPPAPAAAAAPAPKASGAFADAIARQRGSLQAVDTSSSARFMRDAPEAPEEGGGLLSVMSRGFAKMSSVKEEETSAEDMDLTSNWTTSG